MADQITDSAIKLDTATRLAFERTRAAYERTMMAWVRTGTSLITFGFSVYKFFQLEVSGEDLRARLIGTREFALLLIGMGLLAVLMGVVEHGRDMRSMRAQYPNAPQSMSSVLAIFIAALGVFALVAVIFRG